MRPEQMDVWNSLQMYSDNNWTLRNFVLTYLKFTDQPNFTVIAETIYFSATLGT